MKNVAAEAKGELKAILNDQLATLSTDHQLLLKQYEAVSTSYSVEQEKTDALTIQLEKMQAALDKDSD